MAIVWRGKDVSADFYGDGSMLIKDPDGSLIALNPDQAISLFQAMECRFSVVNKRAAYQALTDARVLYESLKGIFETEE